MILRFADVTLDDESRELVRDGVTVHVEPQVFDLILLLARNAERVVTTDEILDAVWDGPRCRMPPWPAGSMPRARRLATTAPTSA